MSQGYTKGIPIDVDGTLAQDSDLLVPSQKAVKTYTDNGLASKQSQIDNKVSKTGNETISGNKTFTDLIIVESLDKTGTAYIQMNDENDDPACDVYHSGGVIYIETYTGQSIQINSASRITINAPQGLNIPKMTTTQRNAITTPVSGLIIYNTTTNKHQGYNGSTWNDFY